MKFEVDMRTFIPKKQGKYFHLWMVWKTSNLIFFGSLRPLDPLGGLKQPTGPLAIVFRIFRKIHFHP
jgi:hypothetical protein